MTIGLTRTENPQKQQYYVDWLKGNDDIDIITLAADLANLSVLDKCDGLVISGGIDIHPRFYRNETSDYPHAPETFDEQRDQFETDAFRIAQQKKIPILGICRGMQLINTICGGTLIQDLGDNDLNPVHKGSPDKSHSVRIEPETLLHDIINGDSAIVNSAHHQAIDKLGEGLKISAVSEDGIVEGIEWKNAEDKPFFLAVQWHPERMFLFRLQNSPASLSIRNRFIQEINKSIANHENH